MREARVGAAHLVAVDPRPSLVPPERAGSELRSLHGWSTPANRAHGGRLGHAAHGLPGVFHVSSKRIWKARK